MKKTFVCCILFASCGNPPDTIEQNGKRQPDELYLYVTVKIVDSCEYIVAHTDTYNGGVSIIHKQNCKNHKK